MAFLDTNDIILHAVLTRKGREMLWKNNARFKPFKFKLFDTEIPYGLINTSDADFVNITNLAVLEPSTNENSIDLGSALIRFTKNDLEQVARLAEQRFIPETEYRVETQLQGNSVFSIENWRDTQATISFSMYNPVDKNYFLTNDFVVDFSEFFTKHGIVFNFIPINPAGLLGSETNQYWFNTTNEFKDKYGNIVATKIGIDNAHKPVSDVTVENIVNDLNIPLLTFQIKIHEKYVRDVFTYLLSKNVSSITENIIIYNNDNDYVPLTDYFGNDRDYRKILAKIPITITF